MGEGRNDVDREIAQREIELLDDLLSLLHDFFDAVALNLHHITVRELEGDNEASVHCSSFTVCA